MEQEFNRITLRTGILLACLGLVACTPADPNRLEIDEARSVTVGTEDVRLNFEVDRTGLFNLFSQGDVDVVCRILDGTGSVVAEDDDSGQDANCSVTALLTEGRYDVTIDGFQTDDTGQSTVTYTALDSQEMAIGDVLNLTITRDSGAAVSFRIEEEGGYLMTSSGQTDTVCTLFNAGGAEIGSDDDSGDGFNCALNQRLSPGTYYMIVSSFNDNGGSATFMVSPSELKSYALALDTPHAARIDEPSQNIEFEFAVDAAGRYRVRTSGDLDTVCQLRTTDGELMAENDDGEDTNCSITHALPAGDYRFVVSSYSSGTGAFSAHLETR